MTSRPLAPPAIRQSMSVRPGNPLHHLAMHLSGSVPSRLAERCSPGSGPFERRFHRPHDGSRSRRIYHPHRWIEDGKGMTSNVHKLRPEDRRHREDHDQPRLCRPRPHRPDGAGGVLLEPHRLHPHRHPQPARATCRRGEAVGRPQEPGPRPAALQPRGSRSGARSRPDAPHPCAGSASIADDVTPELARATIESVVVLGALRASPAVKAALADRIR